MAPVNRLMLVALLLLASGGCGDDGVGVDGIPTVHIESMTLQGWLQNDVRAPGFATDDRGLDSLRVLIDSQYRETIPLKGTWDAFLVTLSEAPPGAHVLSLEVYDNNGNVGHTSGSFQVPDPIPVYDATIYMMRHDKIEPAAGVRFCLDQDICSMTDADGRVVLTGLDARGSYEIGFIEGAHPQFLVSLGESRLGPNRINFANGPAKTGKKPFDTDVSVGINERRIVYFDSLTVPIQELIDNFNGVTGHNMNYTEPRIQLNFVLPDTTPSQELLDSLKAAAYRGLAFANAQYREVPWENPDTLTMPFKGSLDALPLQEDKRIGSMYITLRKTGDLMWTRMLGNWDTGFRNVEMGMGLQQNWGPRALEYWVEKSAIMGLTGVPWNCPPNYGEAFLSYFGPDSTHLSRRPTEKDRQIAIIDLMYDQNSPLTPTGHNPDLASPRQQASANDGYLYLVGTGKEPNGELKHD